MILPWLVVAGLMIPLGMVGSILCLVTIPTIYKLAALPIAFITIFLVFPTWLTALFVFSFLVSQESYQVNRRQDYIFKYLYS